MTMTKTRPGVSWAMSDLFFNTDVSDAAMFDGKGNFIGFDDDRMMHLAADFLACMDDLGVSPLPTHRALVDDFYKRV